MIFATQEISVNRAPNRQKHQKTRKKGYFFTKFIRIEFLFILLRFNLKMLIKINCYKEFGTVQYEFY